MNKLKVGIIGVGNIVRFHMPGWAKSEHAEVVAAADVNEKVLKNWGEKNNINKLYTNPFDLINDTDIDLELKSIKSQFLALLIQVLPDIKMDFPSLGNEFQTYINNFSLDRKTANLPKAVGSKQRNFLSSKQVFANYYKIKAL